MKKSLLTILLGIISCGAIQAQHIDTIFQQTHPQYYYDWWQDTIPCQGDVIINGTTVHYELDALYSWPCEKYIGCSAIEMAQRMYTSQPLEVDGIAACAAYTPYPDCVIADVTTPNADEHLRLFEIQGSSLVLLGEGSFNVDRDTAHIFYGPASSTSYYHEYPIYEVYFDSTVVVADSFYVGGTSQYMYRDPENHYYYPQHPIYYGALYEFVTGKPGTLHEPATHLKTRWQTNPNVWVDSNQLYYYFIWPILHEDPLPPSCDPVEGLIASSSGSTLSLTWTGLPCHSRWQVAYTTTPGHPEQGTVEDVGHAYWQHQFTEVGTYYIYVRGYCAEDSLWSGWSDSIVYQVGSGDVDGIQPVSVLESQTQVYPNPANDRVSITCGYTLKRVELCGMNGQMLLSTEASGHSATIDLGTLAPATYMLVVHTSQGTVAKRLVVQ